MKVTCEHCGHTFDHEVSFFNMQLPLEALATYCPVCRQKTRIGKGTFHFDEKGIATLLSGPEFTPEVLREIKQIAERAKANNYSSEQFFSEAEAITPKAAQLAKFFPGSFSDIMSFLAVIISIIGLYQSKTEPPPIIHNHYYGVAAPEKAASTNIEKPAPKKKKPEKPNPEKKEGEISSRQAIKMKKKFSRGNGGR